MSAMPFNKFYCSTCGEATKIVKIKHEIYPGQFSISYISECCQAGFVNENNVPYLYGELQYAYEEQLSNEVEDE
jgi:hypothetical protein